jgi:N-acetylglucosamine kinase-like BadF-type ATPase
MGFSTPSDIVAFVSRASKSEIADYAKRLDTANLLHMRIADKAVLDLFELFKAAKNVIDSNNVLFCGSVLEKNEYIRNELIKTITNKYKNIAIVDIIYSAQIGAARMAMNKKVNTL